MWEVAGHVFCEDRPVEGALVKFADKETNTQTCSTRTDANGFFKAKVRVNNAGYRVSPYKFPYCFCPAYYDIQSSTDIRFDSIAVNKEPANGESK